MGALLEENDYDTRPHDPRFERAGEYTDMEIGRIHIYAAVRLAPLPRHSLTYSMGRVVGDGIDVDAGVASDERGGQVGWAAHV